MAVKNKTLSVVLHSYYSGDRLRSASQKIMEKMDAESIPLEIIIIDDGSTDNSFDIACELADQYPRISAIQLSKNYTTPYAKFAGLQVCKGGCAVFVPDDLQRPLENVVDMYRIWEQGHKIVIGYRASRDDGFMNDLFSNTYYKIMNFFSEVDFPPGGADDFLADREVIDVINEHISPRNTSPIVEVLRLGFSPILVPYDRPKGMGKSRWTMKKKIRLAKDTFFASSSFPIKFITYAGLTIFTFSIVLIIAVIYAKLFTSNRLFGLQMAGWATTLTLITFFNGFTLLCLGVIAEYIYRIFDEVKGRPGYIIRQTDTSRVKSAQKSEEQNS